MLEEDAKKKWCPFVRLSITADNSMSFDNRGNDWHNPDCIGSDCMMWEQHYHQDPETGEVDFDNYGDCGLKHE